MPKFQAKVLVSKVVQGNGYQGVTMHPVYSPDPADPNYSYSQATPGGEIRLSISNPALVGTIKENQVYLIDFTELTDNPLNLPPQAQLTKQPQTSPEIETPKGDAEKSAPATDESAGAQQSDSSGEGQQVEGSGA